METPFPALDHDLYSSYLTEHYLAAAAGIEAFETAAKTWKDSPAGEELRALAEEIRDDRTYLGVLMDELGYKPGAVHQAASAVAHTAGKLNPLNPLRRREDSFDQIELEALTGMVRTKRCMWETLIELASIDPRLDRARMEELNASAIEQEKRISRLFLGTAAERFLAGTTADG